MKPKITAYYTRISSGTQNDNIQVEKCEAGWRLFSDQVSGRVFFEDRRQGKMLKDMVAAGQIEEIVVMRIDRLGRDASNILNTINFFHQHGVPVRVLQEGIVTLIDGKPSVLGSLMTSLLAGLSEFFYTSSREAKMDGISVAVRAGKYRGKRPGTGILSPEQVLAKGKAIKVRTLLEANLGVREIARTLDCSPNYIGKIRKLLEQKQLKQAA